MTKRTGQSKSAERAELELQKLKNDIALQEYQLKEAKFSWLSPQIRKNEVAQQTSDHILEESRKDMEFRNQLKPSSFWIPAGAKLDFETTRYASGPDTIHSEFGPPMVLSVHNRLMEDNQLEAHARRKTVMKMKKEQFDDWQSRMAHEGRASEADEQEWIPGVGVRLSAHATNMRAVENSRVDASARQVSKRS